LLPGVIHVPYPYPYRCPFRVEPEECGDAVIAYIEEWVLGKLVDPEEVSSIIIEPIQGESGYVVPPDGFLESLERLARKHGMLFVADEVQTGFGRTGRWFAVEHWGVEPDLVATAKAIASGLPLGALIGRSDVMDLPPGSHATTFGGNPVALAACRATIRVLREEGLVERAYRLGEEALKFLRDLAVEASLIGDVRGKGLMIGVELVEDHDTKRPAVEAARRVLMESFKRGVLVIGGGVSTIRMAPPLNISEELLWRGLEILADILRDASKRYQR
nr:aminotransferase class III-fold pyridoxal phosphate-dependent enzyme [Desulfurococcales archaeon]